ncbi:hypothetical protein [Tardiphaga sp.]|uniref:hypothetical protein n=1 Tax=Tardiphaga sp. TaxID=1926292 RepID=UPI0037DA052D
MPDEAAAVVMAHLAEVYGIAAKAEPSEALANTNIVRLQPDGVQIVCLVHMGDEVSSHTRFAIRRLKRRMPKARIMLCWWSGRIDEETAERRRSEARADLVAISPSQALAILLAAASTPITTQPQAEPAAIAN